MRVREKLAWGALAALALGVTASAAAVAWGGPLDPPGPPAPTGPIQAVIAHPEPRIIVAMTDVTVPPVSPPANYTNSAWLDVRDCGRLDLFVTATNAGAEGTPAIQVHADASIDGIDDYAVLLTGAGASSIVLNPDATGPARGAAEVQWNRDGFNNAPFVRVAVYRNDPAQTEDAVVSARLYCS